MLVPQCHVNLTVSMMTVLFGYHPKELSPFQMIQWPLQYYFVIVWLSKWVKKKGLACTTRSIDEKQSTASVIARIILSYAMRWSRINRGNVPSSSELKCVSHCKSRTESSFADRLVAGIPSYTSVLLATAKHLSSIKIKISFYTVGVNWISGLWFAAR